MRRQVKLTANLVSWLDRSTVLSKCGTLSLSWSYSCGSFPIAEGSLSNSEGGISLCEWRIHCAQFDARCFSKSVPWEVKGQYTQVLGFVAFVRHQWALIIWLFWLLCQLWHCSILMHIVVLKCTNVFKRDVFSWDSCHALQQLLSESFAMPPWNRYIPSGCLT